MSGGFILTILLKIFLRVFHFIYLLCISKYFLWKKETVTLIH